VRHARPILFLAILTPCVEFLTGSTSAFGVLTNPGTAFLFVALTLPGYIFPVLLIREALVRWEKGWASLLACGIAYGAFNEGLLAKTYFAINPLSPELGGGVGRWLGVNWPWVTGITLFHMVVSISVPIVLAHLLFPEARGQRFLGERTIRWFLVYLAAEVLGVLTLQSLFSVALRSLLPLMLLPAATLFGGIYVARRLAWRPRAPPLLGRFSRPWGLTLASMGFFIVTFLPIIQFFPFPFTPLTFVSDAFYRLGNIAGALATVYPVVVGVLAIRFLARHTVTDRQLVAMTTGVMVLPLATALSIHDLPEGDVAAAALYIAAIVLAWRRAGTALASETRPPPPVAVA
jgi:hypothetical protein